MAARMVRRFAGESDDGPEDEAEPGRAERVIVGRRRGTPMRRRSPSRTAASAAGPSGTDTSLAAGLPNLMNTTDSSGLLDEARREVAAQRVAGPKASKDLPPGFVSRLRAGTHLARAYTVYVGPDGVAHDSVAKAWVAHTKSMRNIPRSSSDPDLRSAARVVGGGRSSPSLSRSRSNSHIRVDADTVEARAAACTSAPAADVPSSSADTPSARDKSPARRGTCSAWSPARRGRESVAVPPLSRAKGRELRALLASSETLATRSGR